MNKNILITVIIVVLVIVAGGSFMFLKRSQTKPQTLGEKTTNTSDASGKKSAGDLVSSGSSLKCTFSQKETESSGTLYLNGPKHQRTDTLSQIGGKSIQGHIIYDGEYTYMWTEWTEKDGRKIVTGNKSASKELNNIADQIQSQSQGQTDNQAQFIEWNKKNGIDCSPWVVDDSKFVLPTGVEFVDYTSMMEKSKSNTTQNPNSACSVCDSYPTEAQAQCKTTLKCN